MRAVAAGCLAILLVTAACSGGGEPSSEPRPDTSPSSSPPSDDDLPSDEPEAPATSSLPVPSPPPARNDRGGRVAFAEYVLQAWIHALNTNDPDPLLEVSGARPCDGCTGLVTELESRTEEGWYVDLRDVRVASTRAPAGTTGTGTSSVLLSVSLPESDTYFEDGTYRSTNRAHPRSTFEVEMTYVSRRFRLDAFSLY